MRPGDQGRVRGPGRNVRGRRAPDRALSGGLAHRPGSARHPEKNWSLKRTIRHPDGRQVEDNVPEDMSLVLDTDKGLVVVSGCGHAGIINTLEYARTADPGIPGPCGPGRFPSLRSRCGHARLDRHEAPLVRGRQPARSALHGNRGRVRSAPAARSVACNLRGRGRGRGSASRPASIRRNCAVKWRRPKKDGNAL